MKSIPLMATVVSKKEGSRVEFALSSAKSRPLLLGLTAFQVVTVAISTTVVFIVVVGSHSTFAFVVGTLTSFVTLFLGLFKRKGRPFIFSVFIAFKFFFSKEAVRPGRIHRKGRRVVSTKLKAMSIVRRTGGQAYKVQVLEVDSNSRCLYDERSAIASLGFALPKRTYLHSSQQELEKISILWGEFLSKCSDMTASHLKTYLRVDVVPPWRCDPPDFGGLLGVDLWLQKDLSAQSWSTRSSFWLENNVKKSTLGPPPKLRTLSGEVMSRFSALFDMSLECPQGYITRTLPNGPFGRFAGEFQVLNSDEIQDHYQEARVGPLIYRCFEVTRWPSGTLRAGAFNPLFQPKAPARTVVLETTPLDRARSIRKAERERSEALANKKMRQKAGYVEKLSYHVGEAELGRLESEVVSGHVLLSYRTLLVISAPTLVELKNSHRELLSLASKVKVELTPLDGRHLETLVKVEERTGVL